MKSILLIGLGRFGNHIAEKLNELHHQVMADDKNEQRINDALPLVTDAQIGDATSETFLRFLPRQERSLPVRSRHPEYRLVRFLPEAQPFPAQQPHQPFPPW